MMNQPWSHDLIAAILARSTETVEQLLQQGADPNQRDEEHNETALMLAATLGDRQMLSLLLEKGADANSTDSKGRTALAKVAWKYLKEARHNPTEAENQLMADLQLLVEHGANPNIADLEGQTPLMYIVFLTANVPAAQFLIEQGADVNAADETGDTALDIAESYGLQAMVTLLKAAQQQQFL